MMTPAVEDLMASIGVEMSATESELAALLSDDSPELSDFSVHVSRYGGKRLRPALVHLAGRVSGTPTETHPVLGAVIEAVHLASLLHDDVLDEAALRRGGPTVNALHGNQVPVLLGDYIYARAFGKALEFDDPQAAQVLAKASAALCRGEIRQSCLQGGDAFDEEAYFSVIRDKTASLFEAAGWLGAYYAGADTEICLALKRYGGLLGMSFQIIDDCLDIVGDEGVVGKSLGSDLELGKMTLPVIRLAQTLSGEDKKRLQKLLVASGSGSERRDVLGDFDLQRAVESSRAQARIFVEESEDLLKILPAGPDVESLRGVCQFVLERSR